LNCPSRQRRRQHRQAAGWLCKPAALRASMLIFRQGLRLDAEVAAKPLPRISARGNDPGERKPGYFAFFAVKRGSSCRF